MDDERLRCHSCGAVHKWAKLVELPDGRVVGNYSEEYRRYGEARWVLRKFRSKSTRLKYLAAVEEKRGAQARRELREEMMKIWEAKQKA